MKFFAAIFLAFIALFAFAQAQTHAPCDDACPFNYDPVCGQIDGLVETYGNECAAKLEACRKGKCKSKFISQKIDKIKFENLTALQIVDRKECPVPL